MKNLSPKAKAPQRGAAFEKKIQNILEQNGLINNKENLTEQSSYSTQFKIGQGIIKNKRGRRVDFYLHNLELFPDGLVIEAKFQNGPGTMEEKLCYTIENIKYLKIPSIVIINAKRPSLSWESGFDSGLVDYLKSKKDDIFIDILTLEEFEKWTLTGNLKIKNSKTVISRLFRN